MIKSIKKDKNPKFIVRYLLRCRFEFNKFHFLLDILLITKQKSFLHDKEKEVVFIVVFNKNN